VNLKDNLLKNEVETAEKQKRKLKDHIKLI